MRFQLQPKQRHGAHEIGHLEKLAYYLQKEHLKEGPRLQLVHAEEVVEMGEPSTTSIRAKKHSSITVCATLAAEGKADAVISAGHTGAAVAASKVKMRILKGVDRPAIATFMPAVGGRFILVDAGANTDCTPLNLAQFAIFGEVYAQMFQNIEKPFRSPSARKKSSPIITSIVVLIV